MEKSKKITAASFFAGIGGFDLGLEVAGFSINFQCEIQQFCKRVLKHHWPKVPVAEDITSLEAKDIPSADVWCGGFPCQDLSVARGSLKRNGLNGSRSGLFFKFAELAKKKTPRVILIENVQGLLSSNEGKDFAELLFTLERLGYAVSWRLLNSRYFGVPQSRPRVYICAWLNDPISAGSVLLEDRQPTPLNNERSGFLETSWTGGKGPIPPKVAFCLAATSGRHTGTDWSRTYIPYQSEVRRLTPLECERLQGFPDDWTNINHSDRNVELFDSLRYHALGNAVSVPVVSWIAYRIKKQFKELDLSKTNLKRNIVIDFQKIWPGLQNSTRITGKLSVIRASEHKVIWPNAGILWNGVFQGARVAPAPHEPIHSDLLNLVEQKIPDKQYFLSANAAEGILRRVDSQNRHLFPLLRTALEKKCGKKPKEAKVPKPTQQLSLPLIEA